jgi:phosphinothricin acetyltransferase
MKINIRDAVCADAKAILDIYTPYITGTCITFETEVPALDEFTLRIENIINNYPYLVCEADGIITGYAYASKHRERAAYQYSADVSIYVRPEYQGKGIGKALYANLFESLKKYKIYTVYAGITLPNDKSVNLHKTFGFKEVGIYKNVGYKLNKWLDVIWLEKQLKEYDTP